MDNVVLSHPTVSTQNQWVASLNKKKQKQKYFSFNAYSHENKKKPAHKAVS